MQIVISLSAQRAYVYRNGVRIGATTVSTGRKGHETPTGVFTILEKQRFHRSNRYHNAPMPFMQRLTWGGVAMHGGPLPGHAASHGCIRLPHAFARELFGATSLGETVVITEASTEPIDPPPAYTWRPQVTPDEPVSVQVSAPDGQ
jgi:lipoprotein-anchoring transpeptidase ErfK/SrfK